jgi:hypothetical protein
MKLLLFCVGGGPEKRFAMLDDLGLEANLKSESTRGRNELESGLWGHNSGGGASPSKYALIYLETTLERSFSFSLIDNALVLGIIDLARRSNAGRALRESYYMAWHIATGLFLAQCINTLPENDPFA